MFTFLCTFFCTGTKEPYFLIFKINSLRHGVEDLETVTQELIYVFRFEWIIAFYCVRLFEEILQDQTFHKKNTFLWCKFSNFDYFSWIRVKLNHSLLSCRSSESLVVDPEGLDLTLKKPQKAAEELPSTWEQQCNAATTWWNVRLQKRPQHPPVSLHLVSL